MNTEHWADQARLWLGNERRPMHFATEDVAAHGLDVLSPYPVGDHARFRRLELAAALNRLRSLQVRPSR